MGFSVISLVEKLIRGSFTTAGLRSKTVDIDGDTTMHCWISKSLISPNPNPNPNPNPKPILVLIHGFGPDAPWQWRPQVRPLSRRFDLVIPDLVFFGASTTRSAERSEAFQARCVARLLDVLGVRRAHVAGTSYGGFVAYRVAREMGPGRVERVVIASSDVTMGAEDDKALRERGGVEQTSDLMLPRSSDKFRALIGLAIHRPPRYMPDFLLSDLMQNLYKDDKYSVRIELMKGLTIGNKDLFQVTPLPQEVLIVWGEHDKIFPLDKAHKLKKQLGDNARIEVLKKTSHLPQLEDPDRFNNVVINFLEGRMG